MINLLDAAVGPGQSFGILGLIIILGILAAVLVLLAILVVVIVVVTKKNKQKKEAQSNIFDSEFREDNEK